ncbi:hypothetical protein I3843_01G238300 [Carya illinoinensis]|uniref:Uncharacterized protein n=1 Tax=Carya illinoinensis TaxID=32201 RepID=A0A8T1RTU1_CARIL|nr:hypothetical protein CIPAW_01G246700 [Carya illinoinensis]KAG6733942.1 hypothetical protein I3842_01G248000 [Carya illinoinensis]KAG7998034.1 hypothetical protein I3843_01G238300 [Carya illinoinensis]
MASLSASLSSAATTIIAFHKPLPSSFSLVFHSFPIIFSTRCHRFFPLSTYHLLSSPVHPYRPSPSFRSNPRVLRPCRPCHAASPGPPPQDDSVPLSGLAASLSKFQDRLQIFFAVFFWMSLFFWASVWDERSRPDK